MRSFEDAKGGRWQAALMEASFGNVLVIFSRIGGLGVPQMPLDPAHFHEPDQLLAVADASPLRILLASARPWQ